MLGVCLCRRMGIHESFLRRGQLGGIRKPLCKKQKIVRVTLSTHTWDTLTQSVRWLSKRYFISLRSWIGRLLSTYWMFLHRILLEWFDVVLREFPLMDKFLVPKINIAFPSHVCSLSTLNVLSVFRFDHPVSWSNLVYLLFRNTFHIRPLLQVTPVYLFFPVPPYSSL